ncbi:MAG: protein methyltransferase, partial [uncultured bacterium]
MFIKDLLQSAKKDKKLLEAEILIGKILGRTREWIIGHDDFEISSDDLKKIHENWVRLMNGEPLAYITREKEFYGMKFYVDERVLVPRPETEHLVDLVLDIMNKKNVQVVDVGTGCGALACAIAANSGRKVFATEVSEDACSVAQKNIDHFEISVDLRCGNLLEPVKDENLDLIVANLPYIGREKHNFIAD